MFKHILVPTDLTERSRQALDVAVKMAGQDGSQITLLHVIETIEGTEPGEFVDFYERLRHRAERKMREMIRQRGNSAALIRPEILLGKRVPEIVRFAEEQAVDLIVLSSHRVSAADGLQAWGTISYKVGILSNCPVLLVK